MARALKTPMLFVKGDPEGNPTAVFMSYSVIDGAAQKTNLVHELETFAGDTDTPNDLWDACIAAIKTAEGIS